MIPAEWHFTSRKTQCIAWTTQGKAPGEAGSARQWIHAETYCRFSSVRSPSDGPPRLAQLAGSASVEVSSEDSAHPIEAAFSLQQGAGWRAASAGKQVITLIFDQPRPIHRIHLRFDESEAVRTQEFTLRWSARKGDPFTEIVRQQWNFSPDGSMSESEDYQVDLKAVSFLQLTIDPDQGRGEAIASLADWRVA